VNAAPEQCHATFIHRLAPRRRAVSRSATYAQPRWLTAVGVSRTRLAPTDASGPVRVNVRGQRQAVRRAADRDADLARLDHRLPDRPENEVGRRAAERHPLASPGASPTRVNPASHRSGRATSATGSAR